MIRSYRRVPMLGVLLVLAVAFGLGGCSRHNVKTAPAPEASVPSVHFDATVKAYKDGQFQLDGAVLAPEDLSSHFAYLKDNGQLPQTILLEDSDSSDIKKEHLNEMALMEHRFGFKVYYRDDGKLRQIAPAVPVD